MYLCLMVSSPETSVTTLKVYLGENFSKRCFYMLFCLFKRHSGEFPGGPVVRIPRCHCGGPGFDPWLGN